MSSRLHVKTTHKISKDHWNYTNQDNLLLVQRLRQTSTRHLLGYIPNHQFLCQKLN